MNIMKKTLLFFGIVLAFVAVDFASAPLRMIHYALASIIGFITLSALEVLVLYRCKNLRPRTILLASLLGFAILNLPSRFMDGTSYSWPDFLLRLAGILLAYLFFTVHRKTWKMLIVIISCLLLTGAYPITVKWIDYLNYGSTSGRTDKPVFIGTMPVKEMQGQTTTYRFESERTYVLYFWMTKCGYCHKRFPDFKGLYERYGMQDEIRFLAVNPLDAPADENFITLQSDIPSFYTTSGFADTVGITGYPTIVIIRNSQTVFYGNPSLTKKFLKQQTAQSVRTSKNDICGME